MHFHINTDYSFLPPYGIMIVLSFIAGAAGMYLLNKSRGIRKNIAGYLCLLTPLMGVFCGIGLTLITSGGESMGLSSLGGLAGVYAAVLTMGLISPHKGDLHIMTETATVVLPLMYSVSKVGCFLAGCCHGIPYDGIFSVEYTGFNASEGALFPVQLTETAVFLVIFVIGALLYRKGERLAVPVIFLVSAAAKCALDFVRASHIGIVLSTTQILCLVMVLIGIVWLCRSLMPAKQK